VDAIQSFRFSHRDDNFELSKPSISVTQINGGTQVNVIPNRCRLSVDRRMLPGETTESVMAELEGMIRSISVPGIGVDIEMRPGHWDPYLISDKEPIVQGLIDAYQRCTGNEPVVRTKLACTDGSHIYHMGKIPAVLFGPGIPEMSHQVDEYVPIKNLVAATDVFMRAFEILLIE
jgi:acetylornithine deacetylase/succinyl-diaminopimelate desuccinylase-like protein